MPDDPQTTWPLWVVVVSILASGLLGALVTIIVGEVQRYRNRAQPDWALEGEIGNQDDDGRAWVRFRVVNCGDAPAFSVSLEVVGFEVRKSDQDLPDFLTKPDLRQRSMAVCLPGEHWRGRMESEADWTISGIAARPDAKVVVHWTGSPIRRGKQQVAPLHVIMLAFDVTTSAPTELEPD